MSASEAPPAASVGDATLLAKPGSQSRAGERADPDDPLIGVVLGSFRVVSRLGEGGMGIVYEAEHLRLDRRYAIKVIHVGFSGREDLLVRFDREARAMSRVRSDHVVDVVDVLRTPDGRPCIVAEKLEGQDLGTLLDEKSKLPVAQALPLVRQVCRGLASAHAQGIVHRDLKPSNLFLARDPGGAVTLKILDFGVAKATGDSELTGTGAIVGTPAYMAPEQARGAAEADARSDVYSVGAVLYRMLTGRAPYDSPDASVTLIKLLEETPERPRTIEKSIPEGLAAVIERAMAREPADRYASIDELDDAITAFEPAAFGTVVLDASSSRASIASEASQRAKELTRRARWARPGAVGAAISAGLAAGLGVGICLALLVDGLRAGARIHEPELVLVVLGAVVALGSSIFAAGRALRGVWKSTPAVEQIASRLWAATGIGLLAFGVIEIGARVWAIVALQSPGAWDPLWAASRVLLALGAGLVAAAIARRR